jgi:hypothetical protein
MSFMIIRYKLTLFESTTTVGLIPRTDPQGEDREMVRYTFERGIMPKETAHSGAKVRQKASRNVLGQDQCHPKVGEGR